MKCKSSKFIPHIKKEFESLFHIDFITFNDENIPPSIVMNIIPLKVFSILFHNLLKLSMASSKLMADAFSTCFKALQMEVAGFFIIRTIFRLVFT